MALGGEFAVEVVLAVVDAATASATLDWSAEARKQVILADRLLITKTDLVTPEIVENCFSSGVATDAAMVSGLAPGKLALTWIVGKSTVGKSLTGNRR